MYHSFSIPGLLFLSLLSCIFAKYLHPCDGCVPEDLLRSEAYGISLTSDFLAAAVQHVNGTLEPIALSSAGPQYRSFMRKLLKEADIHPYGYGNDSPNSLVLHQDNQNDNDIHILAEEISKIASLIEHQNRNRNIKYYVISTPIFFTHDHDKQLAVAVKHTVLPEPLAVVPADGAAFSALNTTLCLRHFEFNCAIIENNQKTIIYIEYNNSTLSAAFLHFWSGWFYERLAYFSDDLFKNGTYSNEGHWAAISQRIKGLVDINKDKISHGRFYTQPLEIMLMGQLASDPSFHEAVREAFRSFRGGDILPPKVQSNVVLDPVFVSASGAARYAKETIDKPRPLGCNTEDAKCTKIREKVFQDSLIDQRPEERHMKEL